MNFLSNTYGKEFEEVSSDWADDFSFETSTLIIKVNLFNLFIRIIKNLFLDTKMKKKLQLVVLNINCAIDCNLISILLFLWPKLNKIL